MAKLSFKGEILLCEDNAMNRELIIKRLAKAGLKTAVAENGKDGVALVEQRMKNKMKPFDLILMDILMPVMNGLEASDAIRALNAGTPIIAVSPNCGPDDVKNYLAHGMSGCLNKPFTSQELQSCLSQYLEYAEAGRIAETRDDEAFEQKIINIFITNNKTLYSDIVNALNGGDIKLAHRLAHTLKSNAGILGKTRLQQAAGNVEMLLVNNENRTDEHTLNALKTELSAVLNEYAALTRETPEGARAPAAPPDSDGVLALFNELESLLYGGDVSCLDLTERLRDIPGSAELIRRIEYCEFNAALDTLALLKREWS